ncbi:MAG: hypothetical protein ACI92S_000855, partial [Planctomycetaceae bacterium]
STVSPDKEAADKDHDPAFAEASSEKPGILPIPAQTHDKPRWTFFSRGYCVVVHRLLAARTLQPPAEITNTIFTSISLADLPIQASVSESVPARFREST